MQKVTNDVSITVCSPTFSVTREAYKKVVEFSILGMTSNKKQIGINRQNDGK